MSQALQHYTGDGAGTVPAQVAAAHESHSLSQVVGQVHLIQEVMQTVMRDGEHFGVIPGCGSKPTLLKPGAEKLSLTFRLAPRYHGEREPIDLGDGHREYVIRCELVHIPTGQFIGEGVGSCSTMESKYRWRKASRVCPECGAEAIIKGKREYGGGWVCFKKKGGCGAKWSDGAAEIESQQEGRAENEDIADVWNTVLKMAKKRAHVDAILTATAASDIFTQDIEDLAGFVVLETSEQAKAPEPPTDEPPRPSATRRAAPPRPAARGHADQTDVFTPPEEQPDYQARAKKATTWLLNTPEAEAGAAFDRARSEVKGWPDAVRSLGESAIEEASSKRAGFRRIIDATVAALPSRLAEGHDAGELRAAVEEHADLWPRYWRDAALAAFNEGLAAARAAHQEGRS